MIVMYTILFFKEIHLFFPSILITVFFTPNCLRMKLWLDEQLFSSLQLPLRPRQVWKINDMHIAHEKSSMHLYKNLYIFLSRPVITITSLDKKKHCSHLPTLIDGVCRVQRGSSRNLAFGATPTPMSWTPFEPYSPPQLLSLGR